MVNNEKTKSSGPRGKLKSGHFFILLFHRLDRFFDEPESDANHVKIIFWQRSLGKRHSSTYLTLTLTTGTIPNLEEI